MLQAAQRKRNKVLIFFLFSVFLIGVAGYLFLFGKLFAYSPLIVGFERHELSNVIVYLQNGVEFPDYRRLDSLTAPVEKFHRLSFVEKPQIFIFGDKEAYLRRTVTKARFYAYPNGRLMVAPWAIDEARAGTISLDIYLRHELSHTLLYQHMGVLAAYRYPQWLMEGIAVSGSGQLGTSWYPGKEETYEMIKKGNFFPPQWYKTSREDVVPLDVPYRVAFMYSEFACIVDFLMETQGRDALIRYMKTLLSGVEHNQAFKEIFGIDFETFIEQFRKHTTETTLSPVKA